jgi:tetratricopeptide (TPR) repeat protein
VLLHRRIGDALERIHAADIEPHVSELAHHYHEAAPGGDVEKAIGYAMRAASLSFALVAWEEAAAHCERALHALELLPERDAPREIKILLALSEARGGTGDRAGWEDAALRAAEIARRTGDADAFAHAALGLARAPTVGVDPRIVGLLEEALERLPPADGAFRAMATSRLASELYFSDQHERMTGLERQAVAMARRVGDKSALAYTLHNVLRFGGSFAADVIHGNLADLIEELILLGEDIGSNLAMSEGYLWRAMFHLTRGERDAADADLDVYARLIDEMRSPGSVKFQVRAMQARLDGRLDAVEALAYQGLRDGRRAHPQNAPMFFGAQMTNLRRVQGRLGEIEAAAEGLAAQFPQIPGYRIALAQVYAQQERREETRAVFDELARDDFAILPDQTVRPAMLVDLTDACCYLADRARAAALYEMMLPLADRSVVLAAIVCTGSASTQLGALATTLGRFDDAERHFEDAIAMNRKLRAPTWVAEAQLGYGDMLLRRARPGDRERAVTLAQQAHDFAKECGMGFVERKGAELLTSLA